MILTKVDWEPNVRTMQKAVHIIVTLCHMDITVLAVFYLKYSCRLCAKRGMVIVSDARVAHLLPFAEQRAAT